MLAATWAVKFGRVPHLDAGASAVKVVSENSDHDRAREDAKTDVEWALRDLAANLLRVVRGAGKPYHLGRQAQGFVQALLDYREVVGTFVPSDDLARMISMEQDPAVLTSYKGREARRVYAEQQVVRGALQVAASRLLSQTTQERAGEREMNEAVYDIETIRDEARREMTASTAGANRRASPTRRGKPKA